MYQTKQSLCFKAPDLLSALAALAKSDFHKKGCFILTISKKEQETVTVKTEVISNLHPTIRKPSAPLVSLFDLAW